MGLDFPYLVGSFPFMKIISAQANTICKPQYSLNQCGNGSFAHPRTARYANQVHAAPQKSNHVCHFKNTKQLLFLRCIWSAAMNINVFAVS
jgi:hypothetical protein